jgi:large subunit ribosomal protein L4
MRVNKKMKKGAMRSALTDALQSGKLAAIDELSFDTPKTSEAAKIIAALELTGKVLLVLPEPQDAVERSFRNLSAVRIAYAPSLGVYEILAADRVLFTGAALDILDARESAA